MDELYFEGGFGRWNVIEYSNEDVSKTKNDTYGKFLCIIVKKQGITQLFYFHFDYLNVMIV